MRFRNENVIRVSNPELPYLILSEFFYFSNNELNIKYLCAILYVRFITSYCAFLLFKIAVGQQKVALSICSICKAFILKMCTFVILIN